MAPSKVRKEEAELRQIAKQSRLARKEAGARERKQKQREMRAKAKAEALGDDAAAAAAASSTKTASAPRKRQAAIILPGEVAELRQRLNIAPAASSNGAAAAESSPAKSKKKAPPAKGKKGQQQQQQQVAASSSSSSAYPAPNHRFEIHYKNKAVLVDVVLHHIPHQKIDVSETTATKLVVDTSKHTKKLRLELAMPSGLRVIPGKAEYELENGILKCKLPIEGDDIPEELQKQWDAVMDQVRDQKALRFRTGKDGELNVRTRMALLAKDDASQAALRAAELQARKRNRGEAVEDEEPAKAPKKEAGKKTTKAAKAAEATKATKAAESDSDEEPSAAAAAAPAKGKAGKKAPSGKADVFAADRAMAMEAARAAAAQAQLSIRDRVRLAKEVQAKRQERLSGRSDRKEQKQERKEASFARVLDEQKRQLAAKAQLAAAVEEAERKRESVKGKAGKTVSFA